MIVGFSVTGLYIAGARYFPAAMFDWTGALSDAATGAVKKFADLKAAVAAATSDDVHAAAKAALSHHASGLANWWSLKPAAGALMGIPAGFLAGAAVSLLSRTARPETAQ